MYRSSDGGEHWSLFTPQLVSSDPGGLPHPVLGISPSHPDLMVGHSGNGLVITHDGGKTWSPIGQQAEIEAPAQIEGQDLIPPFRTDVPEWKKLDVRHVLFGPNNDSEIWLETSKGIYKSVDGGRSWCLLHLPTPHYDVTNSLAINPESTPEVYVGTEFDVLRSADGGCHFQRVFPRR
jgi:hypothetical protein